MKDEVRSGRQSRKIRLIINHEHIALVLKVKRELCVGESVG